MRLKLRSSPIVSPAPSSTPASAALDLAKLAKLTAVAKALGLEVFPAGAWAQVVGRLEARAIAAETRAAEVEAKVAKAARVGLEAMHEQHKAEARLADCEHEAQQLAQVMVESAVARFENDEEA